MATPSRVYGKHKMKQRYKEKKGGRKVRDFMLSRFARSISIGDLKKIIKKGGGVI